MAPKTIAVLWMCLHGIIVVGCCEASTDTRTITYKEALRIALERNIDLRHAETVAALSEVGVQLALSKFLPDLSLSAQESRNYNRNFSQITGQIIDQSSDSTSLSLSAGVILFDGFSNTATLGAAKYNREASRNDFNRAQETVIFTVASNFLALIQQQEQVAIQRESLEAAVALESRIEAYVNAGARTIADLYQQQATVAKARLSLVNTQSAAELANVDLMQSLQLDPYGIYNFEPPPEGSLSGTSNESSNLDQLLTRAFAQRKDISAEQARVKAAEQEVRVAQSGRWPTISLSTGYGTGYISSSPVDFDTQLSQQRGGSVSLGISIPIFDRHAAKLTTRRAELLALNEQIALEDTLQIVGLQIRRAYLDRRTAQEQMNAAEAQQRAARLALELSQERYEAGAATLVELSQARATYTEAESTLVSARYNRLFQHTLLDYYAGDLNPAVLARE